MHFSVGSYSMSFTHFCTTTSHTSSRFFLCYRDFSVHKPNTFQDSGHILNYIRIESNFFMRSTLTLNIEFFSCVILFVNCGKIYVYIPRNHFLRDKFTQENAHTFILSVFKNACLQKVKKKNDF